MVQIHSIDAIIKDSLREFARDIRSNSWWGKEREAVSLYAFGYLMKHCKPGSVLYNPTQIGIEVRVPKPPTVGAKREVCKDLVIWPEPRMNAWKEREPLNYPVAVLEWKVNWRINQRQRSEHDLNWLLDFSDHRPSFVGYAVYVDLQGSDCGLRCTRVFCKQAPDPEWLRFPENNASESSA